VGLDTGDVLISWLSIAGLAMIGTLALRGGLRWVNFQEGLASTVLTTLLGFALIYAIQVPREVTLHNLSFTPERFIAFMFSVLLLVPFFLSFEILVRRGGPWVSPLLGLAGRTIIILALILGLSVHVIPPVVALLLPIFVLFMVEFEIVAAMIYASSGNLAVTAFIESAWLAWMIAAIMPVTFMI
jgi:hypothetical protein